jgi:hypothetical protein
MKNKLKIDKTMLECYTKRLFDNQPSKEDRKRGGESLKEYHNKLKQNNIEKSTIQKYNFSDFGF